MAPLIYRISNVSGLLTQRWGSLLLRGWHVVDGDTVILLRDRGESLFDVRLVRIGGVDAPEIHSKNALEKTTAKLVIDVIEHWLDLSNELLFRDYPGDEKFGRVLGDIVRESMSLREMLIGLGCKVYGGQKKEPWTDAELTTIQSNCIKRLQIAVPLRSFDHVFSAIAKYREQIAG